MIITTQLNEDRIQEGIEKNRKGNFTLRFTKLDAGKKVYIKLKNHKFKFGANLFMLDEFADDKSKNKIYREKFKEVFNLATLPFYWNANEPEEGKTRYHKDAEPFYRRPPIDLCMEYCEENGIEPRAHGLCYTTFFPNWLSGKSFNEVEPYLRRMCEISSQYADKIPTIEVTNEMLWHDSLWWGNSFEFYYDDDYMERCYKLAEEYFPNNKLAINEGTFVWNGNATNREAYYLYIKDTLARGCKIDVIGLQYHMMHKEEIYYQHTRWFYDTSCLFKILDRYSEFGKPLEITEITIPAYNDKEENEEAQADVIEKLYSLWFSHPSVEKIIYWNLVDGYAFVDPNDTSGGENYYKGGLFRYDMSEKPAFKRLRKLIKEVWTTDEILMVDKNGEVNFRGFYGNYEIVVEDKEGQRTVCISCDENNKVINF
ncbi:MAG: hypothetical protein E7343_01015 [Clostridiales bacterium]|nr:hypothetical protein [Clostridiales bacterium]